MTVIILPPDLEERIVEEAKRRGVAPENIALDGLRQLFTSTEPLDDAPGPESLFAFMAGHIGTVDGTSEALSEHCGNRFTDAIAEKCIRAQL